MSVFYKKNDYNNDVFLTGVDISKGMQTQRVLDRKHNSLSKIKIKKHQNLMIEQKRHEVLKNRILKVEMSIK